MENGGPMKDGPYESLRRAFEVLELQKKLAEAESAELKARTDFNEAVAEYQQKIGTTLREHRVAIAPLKK